MDAMLFTPFTLRGVGARRAAEAGFDVLDIHAAHGYDIAGRMRLAMEIAGC